MRPVTRLLFFLLAANLLISCKKNAGIDIPPTTTDSFSVTVTNGYGSGKYKAGDTVHIFTSHYTASQLFDTWSGDITLLNAPTEWHTWFVMPGKNINVTGAIKNIPAFTLQLEQIKGKALLKPVYSYFTPGHKGFVYLLHGTSGKASYLVNDYEFQQLIKELVTNNFGVIVTEAEEATTGIDANGDGKLRWADTPLDSVNNADYANIRIITDTFYRRGITSQSALRYCVGMSDGGFYATTLSMLYKHTAAVSYCAPTSLSVAKNTNTSIQFCMARYDDNPQVGPAGNAAALTFSNLFNGRGVCSKYFIKERCPVYSERFARRGDIPASQSVAVFMELQSKGYIDGKGYFNGVSSSQLQSIYLNNPSDFPVLKSLNAAQLYFVFTQLDLCVSDHQMYSDFNRATIQFLTKQCQ